ncbi:LacI family DNA-binding transcriptional regulator [Stenotrophomonas sp. GD03993]|uniref:substrate-binding domain-containing protein n=1 Tax=unclassified Stenotrophomonas TaxID=196198 RepID=UPI00131008D5|nr:MULTISPECIES: LacI family DNA-binding transcriptional regulator [unclassified Stenotrophomonas]MBH1460540.1 LacI family DNA-binding transcriptional regulator [Stenotrophomonas maltophilia]MDH0189138.1 LacI family DNA-binding transcriptional regulator [Stenotrophomonas sp. GD04051]MDH0465958.1 LacI family DNA-binding transcriptional regulator [Stenotrophomonas sp. GD03993]MDH0876608.1 LacI family DNA-binding transcriptional regulator [Stenotrophomonas sp. GD03877]MDH2157368.1 LacI family DNA
MAPLRRKKTARFSEIAVAAGVSASTVDRVLNQRGSVSDAARRRVIEAAKQLGVPRILPSSTHGLLRFDVVLGYERDNAYYQSLDAAVQRHAELLGTRVVVHRHYWTPDREADMLAFIHHPPYPRHGLIVAAADTDSMRAALLAQQQSGVEVVTLTSDISGLAGSHYTGIDNRMAGATAGYLLGGLARAPGRVVLMVTSMAWLAHIERVEGFTSVLAARHPQLTVDAPVEHGDDPERARAHMRTALRKEGPVVALYNTGVASAGIVSALGAARSIERPVWLTHEATAEHRLLMGQGHIDLVIDQDPDAQVLAALQRLLHACGEVESVSVGPTRFRIETPENSIDQA